MWLHRWAALTGHAEQLYLLHASVRMTGFWRIERLRDGRARRVLALTYIGVRSLFRLCYGAVGMNIPYRHRQVERPGSVVD